MTRQSKVLTLAVLMAAVTAARGATPSGQEDPAAREAAEVFQATGSPGGLCIHVGATDGRLAAALGRDRRYTVHALAADEAAVRSARDHLHEQGVYGRISVDLASPSRLPYVDNLANLVIVEPMADLPLREVVRVLAPHGTAYLRGKRESATLADAGLERIRTVGAWTVGRKPRPAGMDDWTHARYSPAGQTTSRDSITGPPGTLRWVAGPSVTRQHGGSGSSVVGAVTANGRLYQIVDHAAPYRNVPARYLLIARDAFNGLMLWQHPVTIRSSAAGRRNYGLNRPAHAMAVDGDTLFTLLDSGEPLVALDGRTGRTLRTYHGTSPDCTMVLGERLLLLERDKVRLLRRDDGQVVWTAEVGSYGNSMLCADGRAFVHVPRSTRLVCLDVNDGRELWSLSDRALGRSTALAGCVGGTLVLARSSLVEGRSVKDGSLRWSHAYAQSGRANVPWTGMFAEGLVWVYGRSGDLPRGWVALDPDSGKVVRNHAAAFDDKCAPARATDTYLIAGRLTITHTRSGDTENRGVARGACALGALPANGLLYTFTTDCQCFPMLAGNMAFGPEEGLPESPSDDNRLVRGPAWGALKAPPESPRDWPVYRATPLRGASSPCRPPARPKRLWVRQLGGLPTPPTVADGKVFIATPDDHRVHAFDAADGKPLWSFTAGGRVTAAPTYHRGAIIFGARDGKVYCLRASDGEPAWVFRAAPFDRRMIAHGQIESSWPVEGSLLPIDGRIFGVAGRHSRLGGGITAFSLELKDGTLVWQVPAPLVTQADMLVREGDYLRMQQTRFNMTDGQAPPRRMQLPPSLFSGRISPFGDSTYAPRTQWQLPAPGERGKMPTASIGAFDSQRTLGARLFADAKYSRFRPGQGQCTLWLRHANGEAGDWDTTVPIEPRAMALTPDTVYIAGPVDAWPRDASALAAHSTKDGRQTLKMALDAEPVFDGLITAADRLFLATCDGKLICLGE